MRHLQQVQPFAITRDAGRQQMRIDLLLDVAGEDHPAGAEVNVEHDRDVVDACARIGRSQGHSARQRPFHVHSNAVQRKRVTCREDPALASQAGETSPVRRVTGPGSDHPWLRDLRDPVAIHHGRQAGHVVLVRMGQDD